MSALEVCEGVASVWHYHLREEGSTRSLCGAAVMSCGKPLTQWGVKIPGYHIPESYCRTCTEKRDGVDG